MNRRNSQLERMVWVLVVGLGLGSAAVAQQTPANGEIGVAGTVAGSYLQTWSGDGVYEAIQEVESGGKPSKRKSLLEHKWTFDVPAGTSVSLHVRAHHDANAEGDDFAFAWSTDDVSYADLLTVTKTIDDGTYQTADLDPGISGLVYVRAVDTNRSQGSRQLDALYVDHLYIESSQVPAPPAAPSDLSAGIAQGAGHDGLRLDWTDNSGNEDGFRIERSPDGVTWGPLATVGPDVTFYKDVGLLPETTYSYVVQAFNGQGDSGWSNVASATTLPQVTFTWEVVDTEVQDGFSGARLAYDPSGRPAIAYVRGDFLTFAHWNGSSWDIEAVEGTNGYDCCLDLAFLPDGRPCLGYENDGAGGVRFAEKLGGSWVIEAVESGQNNFIAMAIDPEGNPSIAYNARKNPKAKMNEGMRFARRIDGVWHIELVDEGEGFHVSKDLAYDLQGCPAIAYQGPGQDARYSDIEDNELRFAHWNGTSWDVDVQVGGYFGRMVRLAYDPLTGGPVMVHRPRPVGGSSDELRYVTWGGSGWQSELVAPLGPTGSVSDLVVTSSGVPHVAAWTGPLRWLYRKDGAVWSRELVNAWGGDPWVVGLALDASEQPAVAWPRASRELMFAHN